MPTRTIAAFIIGLSLLCARGAEAGSATLFTPPLNSESATGTRNFRCAAANVGNTVLDVTFEILDTGGNTLAGPATFSTAPGAVWSLVLTSNQIAYCKITVDSKKPKIRGVFTVEENTIADTFTVSAVPATE